MSFFQNYFIGEFVYVVFAKILIRFGNANCIKNNILQSGKLRFVVTISNKFDCSAHDLRYLCRKISIILVWL